MDLQDSGNRAPKNSGGKVASWQKRLQKGTKKLPCNAKEYSSVMVRPVGIEPTHLAPEASALSTELRALVV
jgi:hypothetical protein